MLILSLLRRLSSAVIYWHGSWVIYSYDATAQGDGKLDAAVQTYDAEHLPVGVVKQALQERYGRFEYKLRLREMLRHGGKCLVLMDQGKVASFGWIRGWKPFRRRYGWLARDAFLLSSYWTMPDFRGKGLYGRLLAHTIAVARKADNVPIFIWTDPENHASQRGIEKAGFKCLGVFEVRQAFFRLINTYRKIRTSPQEACVQSSANGPDPSFEQNE
ncbi:MAG: GNAT family N-acetyltransferase [Planctomycetes bacterium]|nr:GNAT family N-acetyltransferase [Planctomycetota bacterium]